MGPGGTCFGGDCEEKFSLKFKAGICSLRQLQEGEPGTAGGLAVCGEECWAAPSRLGYFGQQDLLGACWKHMVTPFIPDRPHEDALGKTAPPCAAPLPTTCFLLPVMDRKFQEVNQTKPVQFGRHILQSSERRN